MLGEEEFVVAVLAIDVVEVKIITVVVITTFLIMKKYSTIRSGKNEGKKEKGKSRHSNISNERIFKALKYIQQNMG